jgi:hypothetical protein
MSAHRRTLLLAPLLSCLLAGCGDTLNLVSATTIRFDSPISNTTVFSLDPLDYRVTATNQTGVGSLELRAGSVLLKTCSADTGITLQCGVMASLPDIAAQIKDGKLHLSVTATDRKNKRVKKTSAIDVTVKPLQIRFTSPVAEGDPAVAMVKGTGTLSFDVKHEIDALDSVTVAAENGPVVTFNGSDTLSAQVNWPVKLKVGDHTLTATVTDAQQRTDTATLAVKVLCEQDVECDVHQVCCVSTGACQAETAPACQ